MRRGKMKITAALLCASVAAGCLTGCGSTDKKSTAENDTKAVSVTNDDKTFIVGFDASFPPYGYSDGKGGYTGFDLELAQDVCDLEGWTLIKQPIDWDAKDMELSSGAIDCIWNGFTINGREDDYTWSDPYIDNSQVYVVASDSGISTPADLKGKQVGVQKDSSALSALNEDENADLKKSFGNLVQYDDYNTAFMDLESGGVECVAMDIGVASYQISSRGDKYKMLDDLLATEQYGIGFKKGNTELCDKVQADLYKLYDDGKVKELAEKYKLTDYLCMDKYENK